MYQGPRNLHFSADIARAGSTHQGGPIDVRAGSESYTDLLVRSVATFTVNTMICCDFSSTAYFHQKRTTSSSAITWIEGSSLSRRSACCSHTRSNIQRIFSFYGATTNAPPLTASMDSTTSASEDIISSYGRRSQTVSIACQSPRSLTRRSSLCMAV